MRFVSFHLRPTLSTEESMATPYHTMSWLGGSALYSHKMNHNCRLRLEQGLNTQVIAHKSLSFPFLFQYVLSIKFSCLYIIAHCLCIGS